MHDKHCNNPLALIAKVGDVYAFIVFGAHADFIQRAEQHIQHISLVSG